MSLELNLSAETEAILRKCAIATGQDLESFVLQALAEKLAEAELQLTGPSHIGEDWSSRLRACIGLHPVVNHFVDDSRESIYGRSGK